MVNARAAARIEDAYGVVQCILYSLPDMKLNTLDAHAQLRRSP